MQGRDEEGLIAGLKGFAGPLMSATCTAIALVQPVPPQAARVRAAVARRVHLMQAPSRPLTAWCKWAVLAAARVSSLLDA